MAKIALASFGKPSSAWAREEFGIFAERLRAFTDIEVVEFKESKRSDQESRLREEAELFHKRFPAQQWIHVLLSEEGKLFKTEDFAKWLEPKLGQSIVFLIGSAYGLHAELRKSANLLWSLSPLTFTHEHARVLLAEQVYRAIQVVRGHPYHHR